MRPFPPSLIRAQLVRDWAGAGAWGNRGVAKCIRYHNTYTFTIATILGLVFQHGCPIQFCNIFFTRFCERINTLLFSVLFIFQEICQLVLLGGEGGGHPHTTQALLLPTNNNMEDVGRSHCWGEEGEGWEGREGGKLGGGGRGGTGAKRGRPCSKPPTKDVVRKRRKVGAGGSKRRKVGAGEGLINRLGSLADDRPSLVH